MVNLVMGGMPILLGLLGLYFAKDQPAFRFLLGLWTGYALFALYFNYHISTHDYYHLLLIPITGLSMGPAVDVLSNALVNSPRYERARVLPLLIAFLGLFLLVWDTRAALKAADFRDEPARWREISERVDSEARLIALTQDYGMRLAYWGWRPTAVWPGSGDIYYHENRGAEFEFTQLFEELALKRDYFLVTDFVEFEKQSLLKEHLNKTYRLAFSGDGYRIYDLHDSPE